MPSPETTKPLSDCSRLTAALRVCLVLATGSMMTSGCRSAASTANAGLMAGVAATARSAGMDPSDRHFAAALAAERSLPREWFVPAGIRAAAYLQQPLPIGAGQTISDPYVVALMTAAARVRAGTNVLEVGTGSGYQAAVLARMGARVTTLEIVPELAARAAATLRRHGFGRILLRAADGFAGWPSRGPFDAIIATAGAAKASRPLLDQLAPGGRLVIPIGSRPEEEQILVYEREDDRYRVCSLGPATFVPFTGAALGAGAAGDSPDDVQPFCYGRAVT